MWRWGRRLWRREASRCLKGWSTQHFWGTSSLCSAAQNFVHVGRCSLRDRDDDVRSAAAATLSPITDALVERLPVELQLVVGVLWDCLGDLKDDLSSSIGGGMDLLGAVFRLRLAALADLANSLQPSYSPSPLFLT